jgi:hypothetical protein
MNPMISVIIPCYNQGKFLTECVQSLQDQTYSNWEAIIVNDGSTDQSERIAAEICCLDTRVRLFSKINGGLSSARNAGISLTRGNFVQFLDADDILLPRKFEKHLTAVAENRTEIITYSNYFHGASDQPMKRVQSGHVSDMFMCQYPLLDFASRWEHDFSIPIHTALFPEFLFKKHNIRFDEGLPNHEDWDFWMKIMIFITEVKYLPEELAIYRFSNNSMSQDKAAMWSGFNIAIDKQLLHFNDDVDIRKALLFLKSMNNYRHNRSIKGQVRSLINRDIFKNFPWSFQQALKSFSRPPKSPFYLSQ